MIKYTVKLGSNITMEFNEDEREQAEKIIEELSSEFKEKHSFIGFLQKLIK